MDTKETDFFNIEEEMFDTVIGSDINFVGSARFVKSLMIKGKISGNIDVASDLVVDTGAVIYANVNASRILIKGKIKGNITADSLLFISQTGVVLGDITAEKVVIEHGSSFNGRCTMIRKKDDAKI